jgi:hypothetical protein
MSEIFRDRTEGVIARREDLLRKRRDEFVMMPHAIRRVVVARAARKAASIAMIIAGIGMVAVALSPSLASRIAGCLPGINPAVISTFVGAAWVLGLVAYATSRARSEHRFAVEMSTTVLPGEDVDNDIDRLSHERPSMVARRMAHRLEVASAALPVAAAAFVLPATLVYFAHAIYAKGWPSTMAYEQNLITVGSALAAAAGAGVVAGIAMTRKSARSPRVTKPAWFLAIAMGAIAAYALKTRELPITWLCTVLAVISGSIAVINGWLAKERAALEVNDPAAGSELFTLRGLLDATKRTFASVRAHITPPMVVASAAFGVLLVCAGSPIPAGTTKASASVKPQGIAVGTVGSSRAIGKSGNSSYEVTPTTDGRLRVTATFVDGKPINIVGLHGISAIPKTRKARVVVDHQANDLPGQVAVTPFAGDDTTAALHMGSDALEQRFSTSVCGIEEQTLGLSLVPDSSWPAGAYTATFLVEPMLELANCDVQVD